MKRTRRTLVIIDVQYEFLDCQEQMDMILSICAHIRMAKRFGWNILVVEYRECDKTHHLILREIGNYRRRFKVVKSEDDGAIEVMSAMIEHGLAPHIRVCGVNSDCCVYETVTSLLEYNKSLKVELVKNGCGNTWGDKNDVLNDLLKIKSRRRRVKII